MARATWNGVVVADSNDTIIVENNHYFPPSALNKEYFQESTTHTVCAWKGTASYLNIKVGDDVNKDAAWYYPNPSAAALHIKDYVAFWRGVKVE
jgi:uncharacterized protein (DUF427 family)